jgi:hypothetical protein
MCSHGSKHHASFVKPIIFGCSLVVFAGEIIQYGAANSLESPYLLSVRPLAVVAGQQNNLFVSGFNLARAVTRYETTPAFA